jgi:hypothetical protein
MVVIALSASLCDAAGQCAQRSLLRATSLERNLVESASQGHSQMRKRCHYYR